jgi:EVE domain
MKYWISVISKDHVLEGMEGGFTQANQGKALGLQLLHREDLIFFYSPGTRFRAGEILQAFTAVARVTDDASYQVSMTATFQPWRRNVAQLPGHEAAIEPLTQQLDFIQDKANWGSSLRRGLFEIGADDAHRIAGAMKADIGHQGGR